MLAPTTESVNCVNYTIPRRGGVTPPYGAIQNHRAVGAGYAPPAVLRLQQHNGSSVGAVIDRPLQPSRKCNLTGKPHGTHLCVPYKPAGNGRFPQLYLTFRLFVGNGLDRSGRFAATAHLQGGVGSPRPAGQYNKNVSVPPANKKTVRSFDRTGMLCQLIPAE